MGNRQALPHLCPDCVINLDASVVSFWTPAVIMVGATQPQAATAQDVVERIDRTTGPPVRGPPCTI